MRGKPLLSIWVYPDQKAILPTAESSLWLIVVKWRARVPTGGKIVPDNETFSKNSPFGLLRPIESAQAATTMIPNAA